MTAEDRAPAPSATGHSPAPAAPAPPPAPPAPPAPRCPQPSPETLGSPEELSALPTAHLEALADLDRLTAIASIDLLNPDLVDRLDEISQRTMTRLGHQAAYVSIVLDTAQLILSSAGMSGWICQAGGTPIEWAFCGHTVALARPYTVEDASQHPAHQASPLVTEEGTRAYAGVPLVSATGQVLGAHCVIDSEPHQFTPDEIAELQAAAAEIVQVLTEHSIPAQTTSTNL